jgi:nicotinate-nucleotide adenylyltransferase
MTDARRIGILGGTFDPIHRGHVDLAQAAESALGLSRVFVIPANVPPHRSQPFASGFHRFAMVSLAVAGHAGWRASDLELRAEAPSYTSVTLARFHERGYAPSEIYFLVGADAFADIGTWKDYPRIVDGANFGVVSRPGFAVDTLPGRLPLLASRMTQAPLGARRAGTPVIVLIDAPTADVSSSAIRRRRAEGQPITGMVDLGVEQHIEQHALYTAVSPGRRRNERPVEPAAGRLHGQS